MTTRVRVTNSAKDAIAAAQQELVVDRSTLARDEDLVNYSRITAPFDGVVTQLNAYTGSLLPAGTSGSMNDLPLCHLSQNNLLRLIIPVPSRIVLGIHIGEVVSVRVNSLNKVFQGKVARFSDQIDLQTRTMRTEVQVPNRNYELVPGMYAYVQLPVKSAKNALTLPLQAVEMTGSDQGTILAVNSQNQIVQHQVQLGLETAGEVQIVSGVHEGEKAVFGELSRFHPGEKVTPETANLASLGGTE
ncbi:MAG: efflux RND transporter periplasmic adaptor subunit [Terriglobia bacterium]